MTIVQREQIETKMPRVSYYKGTKILGFKAYDNCTFGTLQTLCHSTAWFLDWGHYRQSKNNHPLSVSHLTIRTMGRKHHLHVNLS